MFPRHAKCKSLKKFTLFTQVTESKRTIKPVTIKTSQKGLKEGWTRATFILRSDYLEKIKALAYWERKKVKEVVDQVLEVYLKGKRIKPRG